MQNKNDLIYTKNTTISNVVKSLKKHIISSLVYLEALSEFPTFQ